MSVVALDVSQDGSRVLIGNRVSTDSEGNDYFDLYMHVGSSPNSVAVADTAGGVLYAGMTSDASRVFFSTRDQLDDDTDSSTDLFQSGRRQLERQHVIASPSARVGTGDTDSCDPASNSYNPDNWNAIPGGPTDCSAVAIGGGGGVASASGGVYFLSPELLDEAAEEDGVDGAPNLYLSMPGSGPQYVTTLESSASTPLAQTPTFDGYLGAFTKPVGAAIDHQDGSTYVYDVGNAGEFGGPGAYVQKFDSSGTPVTSYGENSKNYGAGSGEAFQSVGDPTFLSEFGLNDPIPTQIAVDNYPSSDSYRDLYVPSTTFLSGLNVRKFDSAGNYLSTISVGGELRFPGAIAVDQIEWKAVCRSHRTLRYQYDQSLRRQRAQRRSLADLVLGQRSATRDRGRMERLAKSMLRPAPKPKYGAQARGSPSEHLTRILRRASRSIRPAVVCMSTRATGCVCTPMTSKSACSERGSSPSRSISPPIRTA